jgi:2-oxoisovalerate dehydrogenase E1 component
MEAGSGLASPEAWDCWLPLRLPKLARVTEFGIGAEIAAIAVCEGFWTLDAPVMRVAPPPSPCAPNLERQRLPDRQPIERAVEALARI